MAKCKNTLFLFIFFSLSLFHLKANSLPVLTDRSIISLVICSPDTEIRGNYGHSCLRVQDDSLHIDVVFNFGTYPDQAFLTYKLALGKIKSSLEGEHFYKFAERYKNEGRGMQEYYLSLTQPQKQIIWQELNKILLEGDRFYYFNVYSNNCTTQIRGELFKHLNLNDKYFRGISSGKTSREILNSHPFDNFWVTLYLNMSLGPESDKQLSKYDATFIPKELINLLSEISINGHPFIYAQKELFPPSKIKKVPSSIPGNVLSIILLIITLILTYIQYKKGISFILYDRLLFLITGIEGVILTSLFLFSDVLWWMSPNYSLLWLLPSNIIIALCLKKSNNTNFMVWLLRITYIAAILFFIFILAGKQVIPTEMYIGAFVVLIRLSVYLFPKTFTSHKK